MKVSWFDSWRMRGRTLRESWLIALRDPGYWITFAILVFVILLAIFFVD